MSTHTTIRPAAPNDLAAVERLLVESSLPLDGVREALADFVVADTGEDIVGVAVLAASVVVMPLLARAKRRVATAMASRALAADAAQTSLCA